ncbi:hypothetical protein LJB68_06955 [bacterium 210820-DFI.6.52]|nr:hypothetical protein [bacterium 210820-DFI.6.52]
MDRMEGHLEQVRKTATRTSVTQENTVIPQLKQLAEGHTDLMDKIGIVAEHVDQNTDTCELHTVQIAGLQEKVKALA